MAPKERISAEPVEASITEINLRFENDELVDVAAFATVPVTVLGNPEGTETVRVRIDEADISAADKAKTKALRTVVLPELKNRNGF